MGENGLCIRGLVAFRDMIQRSWWALILAEHDTEPTELSGGLLKAVIGFWLLLPVQTFSNAPAFEAVSVIPESAWGVFLVVVGVLHLAALRNGHAGWRRWAALIGCFIWCAMGLTFMAANPAGIGPLLFVGAGLAQGWCYSRLGALMERPS
jgi:hypothetical protein